MKILFIFKFVFVLQSILAASYSEKPCTPIQVEHNYKCVHNSCFKDYVPRFKTYKDQNLVGGVGHLTIFFIGFVHFINGDLTVEICFTDTQNDGLTYRDNENSCLDTKILRYRSITYTGGTQFIGPIISSFDTFTSTRKYTFQIKASEFDFLLVKDSVDVGFINYSGYFGLIFQVAGETLAAYNFNFLVIMTTDLSSHIFTSFIGVVEKGEQFCNSEDVCILKADSTLSFCAAPGNCATQTTSKTLYLNQNFSLLHKITSIGFENYYLIPNTVTYSGSGLNRRANIKSSTKFKGSTEILTSVEFAYSNPITIQVNCRLSTVTGTRILSQATRTLRSSGSVVSTPSVTSEIQAFMSWSLNGNMLLCIIPLLLVVNF